MRILQIHNFYQQPGGEDQVFRDEGALLEAHGHTVMRHTVHNDVINGMNRLVLAKSTLWNSTSYRTVRQRVQDGRPDVVHFHNTLPLISPAAYYAVQHEGVGIVQTLHNYRLLCPNAFFFRDGRVCEDCLGKRVTWPSVVHGCYRDSRTASSVVTAMLASHRMMNTWTKQVDVYIAMTNFAKAKYITGGLPGDKIEIKPHFIFGDPEPGDGDGNYVLFVGRLSREKGIQTLISAWEQMPNGLPLKIVGDGPEAAQVARAVEQNPNIEWLGHKAHEEVYSLMGNARAVVIPSVWYETFGKVIIEALSVGTPVIGSNLGAIAELISHGETGFLFAPNNAEELAAHVRWIHENPAEVKQMRPTVRQTYEDLYTPERNYEQMMEIYHRAMRQVALVEQ